MSEFKLTGDYFVSEWNGSSANPGTDTSPFAHPADLTSSTTLVAVIGSGWYKGAYTPAIRMKGDGIVVFDLNNQNTAAVNFIASQANPHLKDITLLRVNLLQSSGLNGMQKWVVNCVIEANDVYSLGNANGMNYFINCILKANQNSYITDSSIGNGSRFNNTIFLSDTTNILGKTSTSLNIVSYFQYNYFQAGTIHNFLTVPTSTQAGFWIGNMINSTFVIGGVSYELKYLFDGSPRPDANPSILDLGSHANFGSLYTNGNFAGDPKFLDVMNKIVAPDSDLLKQYGANGYIGGVRAGKYIPVNSSDPNVVITTTDINTTNPLNWIIQSPATEGFINIVWKISDTIAEVQRILLDALLSFYGDATGGTTENNNVPDNFPTSYSTLSAAGLKPNRLIYELRTSQSIGMPTVDSQWDNDSVALGTTAGNYYLQEWNTKPTIATVLGVPYGNGNPAGIGGATNGINARWGQARIRLTNNRAY